MPSVVKNEIKFEKERVFSMSAILQLKEGVFDKKYFKIRVCHFSIINGSDSNVFYLPYSQYKLLSTSQVR